jgi:hypothetical protein
LDVINLEIDLSERSDHRAGRVQEEFERALLPARRAPSRLGVAVTTHLPPFRLASVPARTTI